MQALLAISATWAGVWLAASLAVTLAYPLFADKLAVIEPGGRAWALRVIALAPALLSILACVGLFLVPGEFVPAHCHLGHCAAHNPDTPPLFVVVAFIGLVLLPIAGFTIGAIVSTLRLQRRWRRWSADAGAGAYRLLDIGEPVACVLGLMRPTIYFSRGFIACLPPGALRIVLAHEQAHAARYDNLWVALVRLFSLVWLDRRLANDLELAQEQACDRRAATVVGDAVLVAEVLVRCQRLAHVPQVACAFFQGQLPARVQSLLDFRGVALSPMAMVQFGSLTVMLAAALVVVLHHVLEFS